MSSRVPSELQLELAPGSGERAHEIAHEDLTAGRLRDTGAPASTTGVPNQSSSSKVASPALDADAHLEPAVLAAAVVTLDRPLHRDPARQRVGRTLVRHHDRVADGLDLGAAGRGDRLAEVCEVLAAKFVGRDVAEVRRQFGRTHEIGEQDGDEPRLRPRVHTPTLLGGVISSRMCAN